MRRPSGARRPIGWPPPPTATPAANCERMEPARPDQVGHAPGSKSCLRPCSNVSVGNTAHRQVPSPRQSRREPELGTTIRGVDPAATAADAPSPSGNSWMPPGLLEKESRSVSYPMQPAITRSNLPWSPELAAPPIAAVAASDRNQRAPTNDDACGAGPFAASTGSTISSSARTTRASAHPETGRRQALQLRLDWVPGGVPGKPMSPAADARCSPPRTGSPPLSGHCWPGLCCAFFM